MVLTSGPKRGAKLHGVQWGARLCLGSRQATAHLWSISCANKDSPHEVLSLPIPVLKDEANDSPRISYTETGIFINACKILQKTAWGWARMTSLISCALTRSLRSQVCFRLLSRAAKGKVAVLEMLLFCPPGLQWDQLRTELSLGSHWTLTWTRIIGCVYVWQWGSFAETSSELHMQHCFYGPPKKGISRDRMCLKCKLWHALRTTHIKWTVAPAQGFHGELRTNSTAPLVCASTELYIFRSAELSASHTIGPFSLFPIPVNCSLPLL